MESPQSQGPNHSPYNDNRQQWRRQQQQHHHHHLHQLHQHQQASQLEQSPQFNHNYAPIPSIVSTLPQDSPVLQGQSASLQSTMPHQSNAFSEGVELFNGATDTSTMHGILDCLSRDGRPHILGDNGSEPVMSPSLLRKQPAADGIVSETAQCVLPRGVQLAALHPSTSELSILLPPFPKRDLPSYQGAMDAQSGLLFGLNNYPTSLMPHSPIQLRGIGGEHEPLNVPYGAATNILSVSGTDFRRNSDMRMSKCVDDLSFFPSSDNVDEVNPPTRTFVKVQKLGSFGRSLDISMFSSYDELRGELARMFGLQGQLEDPKRSGWQLVFVDREDGILLLGDDPWQEFVNNVSYIKILSPLEVQRMGKEEAIRPATSVSSQAL